jgi:hypothetical protein
MGIEHSPPGGRTAGWKVFHLVGTWAKLPHDLEGTDVALGKLLAQPLFHLLPPHRHEIPWLVFFHFSVFCIVACFLPRLVRDDIFSHLAPDVVSPGFRVTIFGPREVSFDW